MDPVVELEGSFESAAKYVRKLIASLNNEQLLYFYARFKQATVGKCNTSKPGFFDFEGKQKWEAWKKLEGMSKEQAMTQYISKLLEVDSSWNPSLPKEDDGGASENSSMGLSVSRMYREEAEISDEEKTIFDWCKDGNADQLTKILSQGNADINLKDSEGMGLLHWACDRGHDVIAQLLLEFKADVNILDAEGQTPLHYASSLDFTPIVSILLKYGADPTIQDIDGQTPANNTEDKTICWMLETLNYSTENAPTTALQ